MPADREVFRAWAARPEVQALSEEERIEAAVRELGLRAVSCPLCGGDGGRRRRCTACGGEGEVFVLGRRGQS